MKCTLFTLVIATGAFAVPRLTSRERIARRMEHRLANRFDGIESRAANITQVTYSSDQCGAVMSEPTATWAAVTGTFTIPTPKASSGSTSASASAWVGIDGYTCSSAILQTGVDFNVENGVVSFEGWYEWYPDYAYDFSGISFSVGDSVTLTVQTTSKTGGTATIINNSKGTTVSHTFSGQPALCEYDAEWIIEDFPNEGGLIPGEDFGTVTFTDAYATTLSGTKVSPSGGSLVVIEQGNTVYTSASASASTVSCSYVV